MQTSARQFRDTWLVPSLVLVLALAILGGLVSFGAERLRQHMRGQMVNRDGEILYAVAMAQQLSPAAQTDWDRRLRDPVEQLALALDLSRLRAGVLAVRVFDAEGHFVTAFPPYVTETDLDSSIRTPLQELQPVSRYHEAAQLSDFLIYGDIKEDEKATPLLEVNIPIHDRGNPQIRAAAQLLIEASALEAGFAALDRELRMQALAVFLTGGGLLTTALLWAFRRLAHSNALLRERTNHLLRANYDLTLAMKNGALGAITAHLVHGLRHPLANLQDFVANHSAHSTGEDGWRDMAATTQRMQKLVHDIVRVLGEQNEAGHYELTVSELAEILSGNLKSAAQESGARLVIKPVAEGKLTNHQANLTLLILENLVLNALQVTPKGQTVVVNIVPDAAGVACEVTDAGPGIPPEMLPRLFTPCRSTKGGSGLGLAISNQLAAQLGAQLQLKHTGPQGTTFTLLLPHPLIAAPELSPAS